MRQVLLTAMTLAALNVLLFASIDCKKVLSEMTSAPLPAGWYIAVTNA